MWSTAAAAESNWSFYSMFSAAAGAGGKMAQKNVNVTCTMHVPPVSCTADYDILD